MDLADNSFEKGWVDKVSNPMLTEFVSKHQHILIAGVSGGTTGNHLKSTGIKNLANEGTPNTFNPTLIKAMMQNAFATAVSASKVLIKECLKNVEADSITTINSYDIVANSAIIINSCLESYGDQIKDIKEGMSTVFDHAWDFIPMPASQIGKIIAGHAKNHLKNSLLSQLSFPDTENMKEEYKLKYSEIIKQLADNLKTEYKEELNHDKLSSKYADLVFGCFYSNIK